MPNNSTPSTPNSFEQGLVAYRQTLATAESTMQGEFDKAVLTLSGGGLGLSFTFLKDLVGAKTLHHPDILLAAWFFWAASISSTLISYFTSTKALRRAIADSDERTIYLTLAQSPWATATKALNLTGGISFLLGLLLLATFVYLNSPH